jgi:hypothetical protein
MSWLGKASTFQLVIFVLHPAIESENNQKALKISRKRGCVQSFELRILILVENLLIWNRKRKENTKNCDREYDSVVFI